MMDYWLADQRVTRWYGHVPEVAAVLEAARQWQTLRRLLMGYGYGPVSAMQVADLVGRRPAPGPCSGQGGCDCAAEAEL